MRWGEGDFIIVIHGGTLVINVLVCFRVRSEFYMINLL